MKEEEVVPFGWGQGKLLGEGELHQLLLRVWKPGNREDIGKHKDANEC